jgi:3-methyl-2-oxobutanoate hydroxymethyltransferase
MSNRKPITLHRLREMRANGEKIAMLTCYDAAFARLLDEAGVDALLVGDSLGMVLQGHATTLGVSVNDMAYHTSSVVRGNRTAWVIADMPFGSYQESTELALRHAVRLLQAGAHMVKLEGGGWTAPIVRSLVDRGIPVCAHLGFTPQSVNVLGHRVQGRDEATAGLLVKHAEELTAAGASLLVLEMVPAGVARDLTQRLSIPTIGAGCSGQVLVLNDMLGVTRGEPFRFVRNFMEGSASIELAVRQYVTDVKSGRFPDDKIHGF